VKDKLNFEASYPHPPARVWRALTDPAALAKWLFPNNFQPALGHQFEMVTADGQKRIQCEVVELDPEKRLSFTWEGGEDEPPAVVSWTLVPDDGGGTRVTLEHQILEPAASYVLLEVGLNWRHLLRAPLPMLLRALAAQGKPLVPMVYVEEEYEAPDARVAGLTRNLDKEPSKSEVEGIAV
jgi:uncharacterized protein YndB with AHSA1/START domain